MRITGEELSIEYTDMTSFLAIVPRFIEDHAYQHAKVAAVRGKKLIVTEHEFVEN